MHRNLKLMADYYCWPVWDLDDDPTFDPEALPITEDLSIRLRKWADAYDATLNQTYPPEGNFESEDAKQAFIERFGAEGEALWRDLRAQLGPNYRVLYYDRRVRSVRTPEDDGGSLPR